ncbi:immunity 50 family protein [Clostridium frigidicarnis]|uniref:Immunity protein 50 n=1 Tax=Clostridium frigidicarnis TaxID=84698 RepID=A0A1I1BC73_9CLOT|nr:immunity 50 family protein [Clostridium frigidicarnis]SFB47372.1 Immunity protein 50 [Clostridium frigidicarnis]
MFEGIDNAVVIKNIFGDKNVFEKAELINVNWQMIDSRIELSILVHDEPTKVPKKWGVFESVYVRLEFYGLNYLRIDVKEDKPRIEKFTMQSNSDKYCCEISMSDEQEIQCTFEVARIQNIKPFVDKQ